MKKKEIIKNKQIKHLGNIKIVQIFNSYGLDIMKKSAHFNFLLFEFNCKILIIFDQFEEI